MFTIKYRTYSPARTQPSEGPTFYDENEQIHGPFDLVSKEQDEDGYTVVHCHRGGDPAIMFSDRRDESAGSKRPRTTLWVMNESGATVAKYDL
jgi:hypothetical protein